MPDIIDATPFEPVIEAVQDTAGHDLIRNASAPQSPQAVQASSSAATSIVDASASASYDAASEQRHHDEIAAREKADAEQAEQDKAEQEKADQDKADKAKADQDTADQAQHEQDQHALDASASHDESASVASHGENISSGSDPVSGHDTPTE